MAKLVNESVSESESPKVSLVCRISLYDPPIGATFATPEKHIRQPSGWHFCRWPEFVAEAVQEWIRAVGTKTAYIERGSSWENGYIESFNARLRDELLDGEIFYSLREAQIIIESWRRHYNRIGPHASLGYKPPAPEVSAAPRQPAPPATLAPKPALN